MSALIFNRADFQHPTDGWYQIEPKGEHPNADAGVVQVIDDDAARSIVNRFNADAAAGKLRHGSEMLIDHEHFSAQSDKETRAYGWLQRLQNRADGIYGRIRWTGTGKKAVDDGDYRFFSTEYSPEDLQPVRNRGSKFVRPLRLDGLSLTNMHNNRGQHPITNRGGHVPAAVVEPYSSNVQRGAANILLGEAHDECKAGGAQAYFGAVRRVMNRHPLTTNMATGGKRIINSSGTSAPQDRIDLANSQIEKLEPIAFENFSDALDADPADRNPGERWAQFMRLADSVREDLPEAQADDAKAVWQALQQQYPDEFYRFIVSFDGPGPFLWSADMQRRMDAMNQR